MERHPSARMPGSSRRENVLLPCLLRGATRRVRADRRFLCGAYHILNYCQFITSRGHDCFFAGHPFHPIPPLERFGHRLVPCHLCFKPGKHFFRVPFDLFEIRSQRAFPPHHIDRRRPRFFQIPTMHLTANTFFADRNVFHFDTSITSTLLVGASMILSSNSFATSTHPFSSITCFRCSPVYLTSALHSESSRTMCLLDCLVYFCFTEPPHPFAF